MSETNLAEGERTERTQRWRSCARWPHRLGLENDLTTDTHDTREQAVAVCEMLKRDGLGGERCHFPLETWTERASDEKSLGSGSPANLPGWQICGPAPVIVGVGSIPIDPRTPDQREIDALRRKLEAVTQERDELREVNEGIISGVHNVAGELGEEMAALRAQLEAERQARG